MPAWDRITPFAPTHRPDNIPDNRPQAVASGGELSGVASNVLTEKTILSALKKAGEAGKPGTINDGEGLRHGTRQGSCRLI